MSNDFKITCIKRIRNYNGFRQLWSYLIFYIAPTIKKKKPSNIVVIRDDNLLRLWEMYQIKIKESFGVEYIVLKDEDDKKLIMFYNLQLLEQVIFKQENMDLLNEYGYSNDMSISECLLLLKTKFQTECCPHEIGIFLGYPIKDVKTYISCPYKTCLMTGYWKVYHNVEQATATFNEYDSARNNMMKAVLEGKTIDEVICSA
ncbi:MAG: DUF3793 family protein [Vallitalea sp.]|nr:DUF3793 family protein [Vallitalea sp.]